VPSLLAASRTRGFRPLAGSYAINELGDMFGIVALAILVLDETGSALGTASVFLAGKFLPALAAPALTAALDRRPVGRVLPLLYLAEAAAFAGLALLAGAFLLVPVLLLAFVDGTLALTGRGLSRGAIAAIMRPAGVLRQGNAIVNVAFAVTGAAGPVLAGLVVARGGVALALWIDAVSFLAVAALVWLKRRSLPVPATSEHVPWSERLREGLRHARADTTARRLITGQGVAIVFFTLIIPIEVVYVKETLDGDDFDYGLLLGMWGLGIVLGSAVYARSSHRSALLLIVGATALIGVGYAGLAAAPTLAVAYLASVVGGLGNGIQWVAVVTSLQEAVRDELQARLAGLLESVAAAAPGIGFVIGGLVTSLTSPRVAYGLAAAGAIAVAAVWLRRPPVDIRSISLQTSR
jgi:MFS family permease